MPPPPLRCRRLIKRYGTLAAVDDISFSVEKGEIFGLLGPNGAGKTTFISMVTTMESPTSGEIEVFGHSVTDEPQAVKRCIGAVPQELISHGFFTVKEILHFHSGFYGLGKNREWVKVVIRRLGLEAQQNKQVAQLSGGMKRRLLIAKALVHQPNLILLDEPTAGVDIELRNDLWEFIRDLNREGATILLTTHYLEEAELLCDRVGIIDRGKLVRVGETGQLISDLTMREITLHFTAPFDASENPYWIEGHHCSARFRLPSGVGFRELLNSLAIPDSLINDLTVREGTLEDAVRHIICNNSEEKHG